MATTGQDCTLRRLIGIAEVERIIGRERTTIRRWLKAKKFPTPQYLGTRRGWWSDVVEQWINENVTSNRK